MNAKSFILIAGAGIAGLTAALALQRRGYGVKVFEQAPELGDIGGGLQIAPNGSRLLQALDLEAALKKVVCEAEYKEVRLWNTGEQRRLYDLGQDSRDRFGAPFWFVHRSDLHRVLYNAVRENDSAAVQLGTRCVGFQEVDGSVSLRFNDGSAASGDILIGADGVHSAIREQMFPSIPAKYTGIVAWRGIADMHRLPQELQRHVGTNWIGPGGHVVTYPLRSGHVMNFVANIERADWKVESWAATGTREECASDLTGWHDLIHQMISVLDQPYKLALVGRRPLESWSSGRCVLIGDAAHPTLPFLAQGSIMALEDAVVLARCLDETDIPESALRRFVATRIDRTTAVVDGSAQNAKRFHNPLLADPSTARVYLDEQWATDKVRQRYDWLFDYDANTVSLAHDPSRG